MNVEVTNVSSSINDRVIIKQITMNVEDGQFVGVIGPNGSGKSTLLKTIYRVLAPDSGVITLNEKNIYQLSQKQIAKQLAVVRQENGSQFDFTVEEIVFMGRNPHKRLFESDTANDEEIVTQALGDVGMKAGRKRHFSTLSGGEKQRVLIARALAQQAKILILDEPTNHLDIHHQLQLLELVKSVNVTVIAALHDLNLAAAYCDQIFMLSDGEMIASGSPENVLTEQLLADVFHVQTDVRRHPLTKKLQITFLSHQTAEEDSGSQVLSL
ncbi:heme ABC transporter ATP-binding protein [Desertibacillus haloalkaliphilus]|uniref:heme ABC transporter ATP-binding protein n=1 Tax=Desertibacillus haloalkaliphilus TaxID=1328930 RepID=UPI001C25E86B|nr:heme ABC transporter ATP-binding protein [Desertibacillus haloalkaliphilus]MBU8907821.1 heme ABC transporter ATP-binding protein [Desertibacillus haloalkaliphilus]